MAGPAVADWGRVGGMAERRFARHRGAQRACDAEGNRRRRPTVARVSRTGSSPPCLLQRERYRRGRGMGPRVEPEDDARWGSSICPEHEATPALRPITLGASIDGEPHHPTQASSSGSTRGPMPNRRRCTNGRGTSHRFHSPDCHRVSLATPRHRGAPHHPRATAPWRDSRRWGACRWPRRHGCSW